MQKHCTVGDFSFTVELRYVIDAETGQRTNHPPSPTCTADEDRYYAFAHALNTAWGGIGSDGSLLVHLLEGRIGHNSQAGGFSYDGDTPDESPDGKVRVYFMDDMLVLDQYFFESAAIEFGLAALDRLRQASQPVSDDAEQRLLALRQTRVYT